MDGLGGNCLLCEHILEGDERLYCQVYGQWVHTPAISGLECPSYEEAA